MSAAWKKDLRLEMRIDRSTRKTQLIEVAVFLFLIVPSLAASSLIANQIHLSFVPEAILSVMNDLALVSLVFYFIWRNGEAVQQIGWTLGNLRQEIAMGPLLFAPVYFGANLLASALHATGLSAPTKLPSFLIVSGLANVPLAFIFVTVVAFAEETIFRGYLILRLKAVTGRTSVAVLLSSFIFSLGHGYEGMAGVISVFVLGVIFALVYVRRGSLVAPFIAHFLIDFTSIILATLLRATP